MVISRERLAGALSAAGYIESMGQNRELFEANLAAAALTEDERGAFAALPEAVDVLVLTEDWCGDSATNLPIVVRLAQETGKLTLHILRREGNEDIADRYLLEDGRNHIPTYIVLDRDLGEVGHLIERPAAISEAMAPFRAEWFAAHAEVVAGMPIGEMAPEVRERFLADLRAFRRGYWDAEQREMIGALRAIAEQAPVGAQA